MNVKVLYELQDDDSFEAEHITLPQSEHDVPVTVARVIETRGTTKLIYIPSRELPYVIMSAGGTLARVADRTMAGWVMDGLEEVE